MAIQALTALLGDLWYDRLTLVGELWEHAAAFQWSMESIYSHVYFLSSGLSTTKFSLEEVLAALEDRNRLSKHNSWSNFRIFNSHAYAPRLLQSKFGHGFLRLQPGDPRVCETGACKARYFGSEVKGAAGAALKAAQTKLKECQQNKGRSFLNKSRTKRRLYPPT